LCALDADNAVTVITSVLQARPELAPPVVNFSVPDLTYPPAKALIERRAQGTIKSFCQEKGFGFIDCEELKEVFGNDVFLHHAQCGSFGKGSEVSFAVMLSKDNKPQAYDLIVPGKGAKGGKSMAGAVAAMQKGKGWGEESAAESMWNAWGAKGGAKDPWAAMAAGWGGKDAWGGKDPWGGKDAWGGDKGAGKGMMMGKMGMMMAKGDGKGKTKSNKPPEENGTVVGEYAGTIKSYSAQSNYGFIDCAELKEVYGSDVFMHGNHMGSFNVGDQVSFTCFLNSHEKPQAKDLNKYPAEDDNPLKRARTAAGW